MGLSLSRSQNLNLLEKEGLIDRNGYFDSTEAEGEAQAIRSPQFSVPLASGSRKTYSYLYQTYMKCFLYKRCSSYSNTENA